MKLPRWRGFNLLDLYRPDRAFGAFRENDFDLIAGWGFDFVRLPMSYLCWSTQEQPRKIDEKIISHIDRAIELGRARGIHVNVNLHRAPGYCVNPPEEKRDLWTDPAALDDFAWLWGWFAKRYRGISSAEVSFDLLNEPPNFAAEPYIKVITEVVAAIRDEDPQRLIVADGLKWGKLPVPELAPLGIAQSGRGYEPGGVSHWKAPWVKSSLAWPCPTWPLVTADKTWDRAALSEHYEPWRQLAASGVGVHMGEFGAYNTAPHDVTLAWLTDLLAIWKHENWGWGLWNLRGAFGVLDSGRADVAYESLGEHQLDRKMLELLQANSSSPRGNVECEARHANALVNTSLVKSIRTDHSTFVIVRSNSIPCSGRAWIAYRGKNGSNDVATKTPRLHIGRTASGDRHYRNVDEYPAALPAKSHAGGP